METAPPSVDGTLGPSVYSLQTNIGQFLLILLLVNELVLRPLQELFKDHWVYCAARSVVSGGNAIQIRSAPRLLRAIGIENFVSSPESRPRCRLLASQMFRIVLLVFLIIAAAIFERTVDQKRLATVSTFSTSSPANDSISVKTGQTMLMSPFPVFGLTEQEARDIAPFQSSGTNSSSKYIVREHPNLAAQYISSCVRQLNDSYTVVYVGAVVQAEGRQTVMCLDGTGGSENRTAARFFSSSPGVTGVNVKSITLSRLSNEKGLSSDSITGVFAADIVDENDKEYKGYAAVTKRSHYDSNVVWSVYALVRRDDSFVWRVSVRLYKSGQTVCDARPCFGENPSLKYTGTWTFDDDEYICPDGEPRPFIRKEKDKLQTVSLEMFPASNQNESANNGDLLAWLIETDYARFVAAEVFEWELRSRVRSDRMFYSIHEGERLAVADGGVKEVVVMGRTQTVVFLTAIATLLLFTFVSSISNCVQSRRLNLGSEIVSFQAVAGMYRSESGSKAPTRDVALNVGLIDTAHDTQHLGLVDEGMACVRRPFVPLD
ncbi:hypothetical protein BWQ96_06519 [Gracilariopsis chorda]|uniref:Uncharacterized protein n=1 Tax=Gracilariopsis chorda TaxID=448386 RepID=A0A2V3INU1_9FLOR|nr:hypothetical protein BWQ96_06519 [Gracilariopsis chorda]|eukprot:PXF43742.1 hypothetical protein BWQ96_06519 [Gracilariopsis chorda]